MSNYFAQRRVCVTGGAGFLGRAVCDRLWHRGARDVFVPRSAEFDLTDATRTGKLYDAAKPDLVIHLAAEVGGIGANQLHPGRFFYANMAMGLNLIEEARRRGGIKFVQVGSVCAYPRDCPLPFREADLWSGYPEETNAPYGIAKRALGVMLDGYHREYGLPGVYVIPVNLYGPNDNFDPVSSHVIPALVRKFHAAAQRNEPRVVCWGSGRVTREFLYVDDAAEAVVRAAEKLNDPTPLNLGTGVEISVADLAGKIGKLSGFRGTIEWDVSRPDGQPRRRLDVSRAADLLGWRASISLDEGLTRTVDWWNEQCKAGKGINSTMPQDRPDVSRPVSVRT
jgi:GDP-L-fucose synthase